LLACVGGGGCGYDYYEPNDSPNRASLVDVSGFEGLICASDVDWFFFIEPLSASTSLKVYVEGTALLSAYDADGGMTQQLELFGGEQRVRVDVGTQLLSMESPAIVGVDVYYSIQDSCPRDPYEPNDDALASYPLSPSEVVYGELCVGDRDWFSLGVSAGQRLSIRLSRVASSGGVFAVSLYHPSGDVDVIETYDSTVALDSVADLDGEARVEVRCDTCPAEESYDLVVEVR